jgi:hypothetical protein
MYISHATVQTHKASRYLKALCNHFNRKVTAVYDDNHGSVQFGFGNCEMDATDTALVIHIQSDTDENFTRVKYVVADHLERFSGDEQLRVEWGETHSHAPSDTP